LSTNIQPLLAEDNMSKVINGVMKMKYIGENI